MRNVALKTKWRLRSVILELFITARKIMKKHLNICSRANKIDEELKNKSGIASNLANIGELYMNLIDHAKALEYSLKSLQLYEELGDKNGYVKKLWNYRGLCTAIKRNTTKRWNIIFKALKINKELENKIGIAMSLAISETLI